MSQERIKNYAFAANGTHDHNQYLSNLQIKMNIPSKYSCMADWIKLELYFESKNGKKMSFVVDGKTYSVKEDKFEYKKKIDTKKMEQSVIQIIKKYDNPLPIDKITEIDIHRMMRFVYGYDECTYSICFTSPHRWYIGYTFMIHMVPIRFGIGWDVLDGEIIEYLPNYTSEKNEKNENNN